MVRQRQLAAMLWLILAIVTLGGCLGATPEEAEWFSSLPARGYLRDGPCVGVAGGKQYNVIGWDKDQRQLIYSYQADDGSQQEAALSYSSWQNRDALIACMSADSALQQYRPVDEMPGKNVAPTAPPPPTPIPQAEFYWQKPDGTRIQFGSPEDAYHAALNSNEGGVIIGKQGNDEQVVNQVEPWNPPPEISDVGPQQPYYEWNGKYFRTREEAVQAAKGSSEGGEIKEMIRGDVQQVTDSVASWTPPEEIPDISPVEPYFEWLGKSFRSVEEAVQAAKAGYEGGEVRKKVRGEDQGVVETVPPWTPPEEIPDVPPLEPYFEWAGKNFKTLQEAVQAAKEGYEGGEVHEVVRGEDQGVAQTINEWKPPVEGLSPTESYFVGPDGKVASTEEEAISNIGQLKWLIGAYKIQRQIRGETRKVIESPKWTRYVIWAIVVLIAILVIRAIVKKRKKIIAGVKNVLPNDADAAAIKSLQSAGQTAFLVAAKWLINIAFLLAIAYWAWRAFSDFKLLIISILLALLYVLLNLVWAKYTNLATKRKWKEYARRMREEGRK